MLPLTQASSYPNDDLFHIGFIFFFTIFFFSKVDLLQNIRLVEKLLCSLLVWVCLLMILFRNR